jgi:outer membrane protein assembly factor BamB
MPSSISGTGQILACGLTVTLLLAARVQGEPGWTQFRGPNATGIASAPGLPTNITQENYLWQIDLPGLGHSSPVFWEGKLIVTSEVKGQKKRQILGIDAKDGRVLWTHEEACEETDGFHKFNSFAASTPAVDGDGVYVSWISGKDFILFALNHEGKQTWRHEIPCGFRSDFGPGASPIVFDGTVIMSNEHSGSECFLIGVDATSGEIAWRIPRKTSLVSFCTPKICRPESGPVQVIFASTGHGVTSVDPKSGKIFWELPCDFTLKPCATPVIAEGVVFVTTGKGSMGVETVAVRLPDVTRDEKPEILYRATVRLPYVPTPLAFDGKFLLWTDAGFITCIEAKSGKELWSGKVSGKFFSSPLLIDDRIYNTSLNGQMTVLASDRFKILAQHDLPEGTHATPAVIGGRMYVRTYEKLMYIGK